MVVWVSNPLRYVILMHFFFRSNENQRHRNASITVRFLSNSRCFRIKCGGFFRHSSLEIDSQKYCYSHHYSRISSYFSVHTIFRDLTKLAKYLIQLHEKKTCQPQSRQVFLIHQRTLMSCYTEIKLFINCKCPLNNRAKAKRHNDCTNADRST